MKQSVLYNDLIKNQAFDKVLTAADISVACGKPILLVDWINDNLRNYSCEEPESGDSLYLTSGAEVSFNYYGNKNTEIDYVELYIPEMNQSENLPFRVEGHRLYIPLPGNESEEIDPTNPMIMDDLATAHGVLHIVYANRE